MVIIAKDRLDLCYLYTEGGAGNGEKIEGGGGVFLISKVEVRDLGSNFWQYWKLEAVQ